MYCIENAVKVSKKFHGSLSKMFIKQTHGGDMSGTVSEPFDFLVLV